MMALAYLNSKTFEILRSGEIAPPALWFYVDDRLAETIQALNLRGYPTVSCRIDPPFSHRFQVTLINVRDSEGKTPAPADIARLIEAPDAPFAVLSFQGTPGHPLRISANKADWMRDNAASFQSLKQIIHDDKRIFVESNTFAIVNCNDPNRLAQIQQLRDKTPTTT